MDYMKQLNNKLNPQNNAKHDGCIKELYSCGRESAPKSPVANLLSILFIMGLIAFVVYRISEKRTVAGVSHMLEFVKGNDIFKMFIALLLLVNIKTITDSFIYHIVLPIMKPIMPLLSSSLRIKVGLFNISIGEFVSDLIVFMVNVAVIYGIYLLA
jgi:hypothetical protein